MTDRESPDNQVQRTPTDLRPEAPSERAPPSICAQDTVMPTAPPPTASASSLPSIAGYDIQRELGRGGMGVVYLGRHLALHRTVALKLLLHPSFAASEARRRFLQEAETLARLQHPGIVQIFDIGTAEGALYFALEYVPGGNLEQHLAGVPRLPTEAAAFLAVIADAVQAAHDQGIVHRDLKPANILLMLNDDCRMKNENETLSTFDSRHPSIGIPKIADFGLAKQLESDLPRTSSGAIMGTPSYMAPEQAEGKSNVVGPAADVYALGAIGYELLTGRPPFRAATPLDTLVQVVSQEPVPTGRLQPTIPKDLETICLKCLHKDPARRYPSARAMADDLRRFLAGLPIQARPVGAGERFLKWARRKPALAGLLAAVLLAVVGLTVTVLLLWKANQREAELRLQAQHQQGLAQQNARQAQENFRRSKQAVDDLYVLVTETPLFQAEEMSEVRRALLEKALKYYEQFLDLRGDDPQVRADAAKNQGRVSEIARALGDLTRARQEARNAVRQSEGLVQEQPEHFLYQELLGRSWGQLGKVHFEANEYSAAILAYSHARDVQRAMVAAAPQELWRQAQLAVSLVSLTHLQEHSPEPFEKREKHFQETIDLCRGLAAAEPHVVSHRDVLAFVLSSRANQLSNCRRIAEAEKDYLAALSLREGIVKEQAANRHARHLLAVTHHKLGAFYGQTHRVEPAMTHLRQALLLYEELVQAVPRARAYQASAADLYASLGGLSEVQNELKPAERYYQQALERQERITQNWPEVAPYQSKLAEARSNLGRLQKKQGNAQGAETHLREAIRIRRELVRKKTDDVLATCQLIVDYRWLCDVLYQLRRYPEMESICRTALGLLEAVRQKAPTTFDLEYEEGILVRDMGTAQSQVGNKAAGLESYQRALRIWQELVRRQPKNQDYQDGLASTWNSLGLTYVELNDHGKAEPCFQKALALGRHLHAAQPENTTHRLGLARTYTSLGQLEGKQGRPAQAHAWFEQALAVLHEARKRRPSHAEIRTVLRWTYNDQARVFADQRQFAKAAQALERAIEYDDHHHTDLHVWLALRYVQAGDHARAVQAATQLQDHTVLGPKLTAMNYAGLAQVHAKAMSLVGGDAALKERYALRAMALLQRARKHGFFKEKHKLAPLFQEPDFAPLREYASFKQLLRDLELEAESR